LGYWRRRDAGRDPKIKELAAVLHFAVGHGATRIWMKARGRHGSIMEDEAGVKYSGRVRKA
jgi:hypothetical protein